MEPSSTRHWIHSCFRRILRSHYAPWITHLSLVILTASFFALLLLFRFWIVFIPAVMIAHRIGVLLHEYLHGIPFRRYRNNLVVLSCFDGLMLLFGLFEIFRATHLAHHRWLNTELDPAKDASKGAGAQNRWEWFTGHSLVQNLFFLGDHLRGRKSYVRLHRVLLGAGLSSMSILLWWQVGHLEMIWKVLATSIFTALVPVALRGAIEHYSHPGDPSFANEYRVLIPLFNINRHIHHHIAPTVPWYLLQFKTERSLSTWNYFTYWFRVNVKKDLVLMQPMNKLAVKSERKRAAR